MNFIEETFGLKYIGNGPPSETYADQRVATMKEKIDDMFDYTQEPITFQEIPANCNARDFLTHRDNTPAGTY